MHRIILKIEKDDNNHFAEDLIKLFWKYSSEQFFQIFQNVAEDKQYV